MNKTKIEWADKSWNPIVGCYNNCDYCYARKLNKRFKFIENWNKPQFFPERLKEPIRLLKRATIFVGSMSDMFHKDIPWHWIQNIIFICKLQFRHKFMFLTKFPENYAKYDFPANCWLGTTIEHRGNMQRYDDLTKGIIYNKLFISIEPIQSDFHGVNFDFIDLIIVGALTGKKDPTPPEMYREWVKSIKHNNIFLKNNIKKYLEAE